MRNIFPFLAGVIGGMLIAAIITVVEGSELVQKVHKLGNYTLLQHMVQSTEDRRQVIIAMLLVQQYVESSFNPNAKSSANALGISQILPHNLKQILNLRTVPSSISLDLGIYAQVKWFEDSYKYNYHRLLEVGKRLGIKVKVHHVLNMYLIQYIGGQSAFGSDDSYEKVLRGEKHDEPVHAKMPYAVNLYATKILGVFQVLSEKKMRLSPLMSDRKKEVVLNRMIKARKLLIDLGYDMEYLKQILQEDV